MRLVCVLPTAWMGFNKFMKPLLRGQIYRVNLEPAQGSEQQGDARPCMILSITPFNAKLKTVSIVPLSSSPRALPPLIVSTPSGGKPESTALCHQIRVIDKSRIGKYMGNMSADDIAKIEVAVRQIYGL
jgi:mRNA interferase MazF